MPEYVGVIVPAIPPRPPQLSLVNSAVTPGDQGDDPSTMFPDGAQLALLPDELRAELEARRGDMWIRGLKYAPENHGLGWLRDRQDYTALDEPAIPAPPGLALQRIGGGTIPNETVSYQVTAVDANGETTALAATTLGTGAGSSSVVLTWIDVDSPVKYNVYGRVGGSIGLLTPSPIGPFSPENPPTFTDTGAATPGVAPPGSNTTGGSGVYTNLGIVNYIPFVVEAMDRCSSWGWSERDFKGRALRWLDNTTPASIEKEFWTGTIAQAKSYPNNYLTNYGDPNWVDVTPGSVPSIARGMQILQDALQTCGFGGQGMIHCQAQTAPNLLGARRVGKLLLDVFDNLVVPGVGYPGTAPGNVTANTATQAYMFATDLVMVRSEDEGQVFPDTFGEALDRGQSGFPNTITFRAQRFAAAYWDGACHFGCRVTLAT